MYADITSDLHSEHWKTTPLDWKKMKNDKSEILIIAGDISHYNANLWTLINDATSVYKYVIFTDGNHEHYSNAGNVEETMIYFQNTVKKLYPNGNVVYLDGKKILRLDDTVFIGVNAWYDFKIMEPEFTELEVKTSWYNFSNDSRVIRYSNTKIDKNGRTKMLLPDGLAKKQYMQLRKKVKKYQEDDSVKNIVIVTHTAPLKDLLIKKPNDKIWNTLSGCYGSSLLQGLVTTDKQKKIKFWISGHTHRRLIKKIDNLVYVNNSRGYPQEEYNKNYNWRPVQIEIK